MKPQILITIIVNRYIGVSGGYLGDFTYRTHHDFYAEYCGLQKDTSIFEGTTRERFINIFLTSSPNEQAKIIRGVVERFPLVDNSQTRTKNLRDQLLEEAHKLENQNYLDNISLDVTSEIVFEALEDAKSLIEHRKAVSAVDRVHTALQGYMRNICKSSQITFMEQDNLVVLIKKLFQHHQKLNIVTKPSEIKNIVRNIVSISDSLNPIRNQGSLAHPNENLLEEPEATLVINTTRALMFYLESKLNT